ncbi:hypothetical protein BAE44_0003228 [Dichanthelium oligosanthes]|uniref:Phospholipase A1 n=1 Tax=Dichanthelium oligosanthes TaxID=888268 RepID=A0A1E5WEC2_9POAL|nr:hypothetical protein BAE44_0003228 [Dichanthelium oligosanthes]
MLPSSSTPCAAVLLHTTILLHAIVCIRAASSSALTSSFLRASGGLRAASSSEPATSSAPLFSSFLRASELIISFSILTVNSENSFVHLKLGYLHCVAGEQGSAGGFNLEVDCDVALVNKDTDADDYPVPAGRWVLQNKGMVKNAQGKWELKDFEL